MEQQVWVCGSCRSINQPRETRCYRCRTPREIGEADLDSMPASGAVPKAPTAAAIAPFQSSIGLATTAQVLILVAVAVVAAVGLIVFLARVGPDAEEPFAPLGLPADVVLPIVQLIPVLAALAAFAAWLSRVVANVPALGGGFTNVTPRMALVENFIPVANLFRIPAILRDVMTRIEAGGRGDALMIGSWLGFVSAIFLPRLNVFVSFVSTDLATMIEGIAVIGLLAVMLQVIGGILLVALIQHIESVVAERVANPRAPVPIQAGVRDA